jgi:hypothetical protein
MAREIALTQGFSALVDDDDFLIVASRRWHVARRKTTSYAATSIDGKYVLMHRYLMGACADVQIDHRDGNGLNNTRANLRVATAAENSRNRQGRGESLHSGVRKINGAWSAFVSPDGMEIYLGRYQTELEAAGVAAAAAQRVYGAFARGGSCDPDFDGLRKAILAKRKQVERLEAELEKLGN